MSDRLFYLTFTTYGTWLPGDARGSRWHGSRFEGPRRALERRARDLLLHPPIVLGIESRRACIEAALETCRFRGWRPYALNVRTTHEHVVIHGPATGDQAFIALKSNATRIMKERGLLPPGTIKTWTENAYVCELVPEQLAAKCRYVLEEQGENVEGTFFDGRLAETWRVLRARAGTGAAPGGVGGGSGSAGATSG